MKTLDSHTKEVLDIYTHHEIYQNMLLELDSHRFRGLGHPHLQNFIRHGLQYGKATELLYINDIAYVLYIMSFLGSYFYEDFRYQAIHKILNNTANVTATRMEKARDQFIEICDIAIGEEQKHYRQALQTFHSKIESINIATLTVDDAMNILDQSWNNLTIDEYQIVSQALIKDAYTAAKTLQIESESGISLCFILGFWLGSGFYKDPLYPWVRAVNADYGSGHQIGLRIKNIADYAIKRLKKQFINHV
jgi:hypothetical protein